MRYLFVIALLFSFMGIANADGVPVATDPYNYPTVWTQDVYNGSTDDITSAICVRWDNAASDGTRADMGMWVETVDNIADNRTAGVVPYGAPIANGSGGQIIVKGPAIVHNNGNVCTAATGADGTLESDATGWPVDYTAAGGTEEATIGWSIIDNASGTFTVDGTDTYSIIFVDPAAIVNN